MIKLYVIRESVIGDDLKVGDICLVTEEMWYSDHLSALVTKPDCTQFWYNKCQFKTVDEIRNDKLNHLGI